MSKKPTLSLIVLLILLALPAAACGLSDNDAGGPPRNAETISVVANTALAPWLRETVTQFNAAAVKTTADRPVYVVLDLVDAGRAVPLLADGQLAPALWLPDDLVWAAVAADAGAGGYQADCASVAESPLVLALWRPLAESLGWPGRDLGWFDINSLASDPASWSYYSGGQFGDLLRLGHTHPGLSASGTSTLLALVQAAERQTEAVGVAEIEDPLVRASVSSFESAVAWFSPSTESLAQGIRERGSAFLGAAVMYESDVVGYGDGQLVPIYPFEGTYVATHPACVNSGAAAAQQEAARLFRAYLTDLASQTTAVTHGLRPVNPEAPIGPPLDNEHGVDLTQPTVIFSPPSVATIYAVQDLWQSARKDVNLVMLLDTSGSMRGQKMDNMIAAAAQFVQQMGDDDRISIIAFATEPAVLVENTQVGEARDAIIQRILGLRAAGDTTLFDAIGDGAELIARTTTPDAANALIVLTDGRDTRSYRYRFNSMLIDAATANNTTIFTIAYGSDADQQTLSDLAQRANGNFYLGDEASIAAIYDEMSAAFGGSLGIGR